MAERLVGKVLVTVAAFADREIAAPALLAFAAGDGERDDDAVALAQLAVDPRAGLDDLAHHLVAHDVAGQDRRDEVMKEMEVRATDRAARHFDDRIPGVLDLRIGDAIAPDILFAVPDQCAHGNSCLWGLSGEARAGADHDATRLTIAGPNLQRTDEFLCASDFVGQCGRTRHAGGSMSLSPL